MLLKLPVRQKAKSIHSELVLSMRKVTKFTGLLIIPLGILLFIQALLFRDNDLYSAVVTTSAGLLGMLPKGLYLLISIGLAAGVVSLSKKNVLVQDLYSLENLVHVDVLCLDKTGTLTEGEMRVEDVVLFPGISEDTVMQLIGSALQDGQASVVVPIDKLSILVTIAFSYFVLKEKLMKKALLGLVLMTAGTLMLVK